MGLKFRRGTTAQKSGSLAFGEPYVNTDLNTLQVGGANGDILLAAAGTASVFVGQSVSASSWVSASSLHVTGNANVGGDLTIGGKIQIGDNSSDTVNVVASLSSSLIPSLDNTFDLGSLEKYWRDLYISTGSIKMVSNGVVVSTLSNTGNGFLLDQGITARGDSSFGTSSAAVTSVTGSLRVSGSAAIIGELSASTINGIGNVSLYSSSVNSRLVAAESFSSSLDTTFATDASVTSLSSSVKAVTDTFATSASVASATAASITSLSGSIAAEQYAKLNASNIFTGTQVITGSLYVSSNLIVQGSSSLQNITASAVSIGTNTVILNTDSPSVRFGGISVIDSGSGAGASGSLFWDSNNNVWLYQNPDGAGYASAKLISGPKNSGSLGSEVGLTVGQVPVAVGDDHIGNSIISASATKVTIAGDLDTTGNISASTISGIGNVTTYSTSVDSRIVTNVNSAAGAFASASAYSASIYTRDAAQDGLITTAQNSANGAFASASAYSASIATTDAAQQVQINALINNYVSASTVTALSTSVASRLNTVETAGYAVSSSVATATANSISTLSGSIFTTDATQTNNIATATAAAAGAFASASAYSASIYTRDANQDASITTAQNSANGAFASASAYSGSFYTTINTVIGTVTTAQNTGAGAFASASAYSASAVTTYAKLAVANTFTANQIVSGSITATGDVVAYSTSDKRHKNNIVNITDALVKVTKLNGVTWEWNDDVDSATKETPKTGLIAQEVQEVLPEVVKERGDGFLALDYSKMMGLMVEAIKEQQTQITELKAEIEALKK